MWAASFIHGCSCENWYNFGGGAGCAACIGMGGVERGCDDSGWDLVSKDGVAGALCVEVTFCVAAAWLATLGAHNVEHL